ncbi:MAG: potassium transporter TrkA, partial [Bacteroidetes bacterium HGW-Bacteroidetes-23]
IEELKFRENYKLNIITVMRKKEKTNLFGNKIVSSEVIGLPTSATVINPDDVLVVFGLNKDISKLLDNY